MNDWIVANITNPDFSVADFLNIADMSLDNTQLLSKKEYLKSDFIRNNPLFLTELGTLSEDKFNAFYEQQVNRFKEFLDSELPLSLELDMFDTDRDKNTKVRDNKFSISRGLNPDRQKIGIEGINVWSTPELSRSEIALNSKIWDTKKGEYQEYSPNDKALFNGKSDFGLGFLNSLFSDPLVMAQWDEDGEHIDPITGLPTQHKKGDLKLNDEGTYYYETLNGRSPIGRKVLSTLDTLTIDGSNINKYDFFDSDDIEKSVSGVITKNLVLILPMFLGGPIGTIYSTAIIAKELAKSLPMLYNISTMFFDSAETPKWLNTIAAVGDKFTSGTSDYAKENTFSIENLGSLISDVALLWGQQKTIATAFNKLKGSKNYIDDAVKNAKNLYEIKSKELGALTVVDNELWKATPLGRACLKKYLPKAEKMTVLAGELGRDLSLAYMAIISNSDVYGDMLQHGASKSEAAAVALGSILGMYAVDKYGNLGTVFFDDATEESVKQARGSIKKELFGYTDEAGEHLGIKQVFETIKNSSDKEPIKLLKYIKTASDISKKWVLKYADDLAYHTTNFAEKALTEGLEEVSEELVTDTAKSIYELAGKLGLHTTVLDVGSWDNALERYTMSFLGGAIGGGIFYGKEVFDGKSFKRDKSNEEMATLIRNGHGLELRDEVERLRKKGKLGNTKLSAIKATNSNDTWLTASAQNISQNDAIAKLINDKITTLEAVINNNLVNLSDDLLFNQMVLSEARFDKYREIAPVTNYYLDFNNVFSELAAAELDLAKANSTVDGTITGEPINTDKDSNKISKDETRETNIATLQARVDEKREQLKKFLSGDSSLEYTRKLNFAMDRNLHKLFLPIDEEQLYEDYFKDKNEEDITEEEKLKFFTEILPQEKLKVIKSNLTEAWEKYKSIEKEVAPKIKQLTDVSKSFKLWSENFQKNFDGSVLDRSDIKYVDRLEGETDESIIEFRKRLINPETGDLESEEDWKNRQLERTKKIRQLNDQKDLDWITKLSEELDKINWLLDPISADLIKRSIPIRMKTTISNIIKLNPAITPDYKKILKLLKPDLSNIDEVINNINTIDISNIEKNLQKFLKEIRNTTVDSQYDSNLSSLVAENAPIAEQTIGELLSESNENNIANIMNALEIKDSDIVTTVKLLLLLSSVFGEDVYLADVINSIDNFNYEDSSKITEINSDHDKLLVKYKNYIDTQHEGTLNTIQTVITDIQNNPIYLTSSKIQSKIKNPIIELVKDLAGKVLGDTEVPNVEKFLNIIHNDFENIEDANQLRLDDTQLKVLNTTKDALKMISTFIYAASAVPTTNTPIGHNKVFNEFAKNHKDVISNWEELPELDMDYATMYTTLLNQYANLLEAWILFSLNNAINKQKQFAAVDKDFSKSLFDLIQSKIDAKVFKVKIDDKEYNLLLGYSGIILDLDKTNLSLYNLEKLIYKNFLKALQESGLTITDFLNKSHLLDMLVADFVEGSDKPADYSQIAKQKIAKLKPNMTYQSFTLYDKLIYFSTLLTLNPSLFYAQLKNNIKDNPDIAPITILEYSTKISIASNNLDFKDIIQYAFNKSGDTRYCAVNTLVCFGVAGAGKSLVIAKSLKDYYKPEEMIVAGPTLILATELQKSLGTTKVYTIEDLLKLILTKETYAEILEDIKIPKNNNNQLSRESKYFTRHTSEDGFDKYCLKEDAPLVFNQLEDIPKVLIIDEATHMNTIYAEILDKYMGSVGGSVKLLGDSNQRSFVNPENALANIREVDLFTVRTPKLTVSLRDNNILKQSNLEIVRSLLDQVQTNIVDKNIDELETYWPQVANIISKFNFKVYHEKELNGDLIVPELSKDIINTILEISKNPDKTIGFIGNASNSAAYKALVDAGLKDKITVLSMNEMQGLEFDTVIIDEDLQLDETFMQYRNFLLSLYTLMSRGRESSIFIDRGLSKLIGKNTISEYLAKAPSIKDKINGISIVDSLRTLKLKELEEYDLTAAELEIEKNKIEKDTNESDFTNPDTTDDGKADAFIEKIIEEDKIELEEDIREYIHSEFTVPAWGSVTYMGVDAVENITKKDSKGVLHTNVLWKIPDTPKDKPLRNLSALYKNGEAFWYDDKMAWQESLYKVKSVLLFGHTWDETRAGTVNTIMPNIITSNFNREDWEKGTYELEIREANNEVLPISSSMQEVGFEYKGKRYIANIVFKVKNKKGRDCIFDLSGINLPKTLLENIKTTIIPKIKNKLNNPKTDLKTKDKLLNILNTIENESKVYANLFDTWINTYNKNKEFSLNITKAIELSKFTWFKRRAGEPLRLGGKRNPITGNIDAKDLRDLNPGFLISKVYTYADRKNEVSTIDKSIKGKAVVFVTSDKLLNIEDLPKIYFQLKTNPEQNNPIVRMVVLDNYGLTLSLLIGKKEHHKWDLPIVDDIGIELQTSSTFNDSFLGGDPNRKPIKLNYLGILMFTSMWNFRAALILFNKAINNWKEKNSYSDEQVDAIIKAAYDIKYNKYTGTLEEYLNRVHVSEQDLENLEIFNKETIKDIPMFRLGYSYDNKGFHILHFDTTNSTAYDKDSVDLAVINPAKALKFETIIDHLFRTITVNEDSRPTLGLLLLKKTDTGLEPWGKDEFIDLKNAEHRRSLSNILKGDHNGGLVIADGDKTLAYAKGELWSAIPPILANLVKTVEFYLYFPDELSAGVVNASALVRVYDMHTKLFDNIRLKTQIDTWLTGDEAFLRVKEEDNNSNLHPDRSMMDMLELMFHGTTDDIHRKYDKNNPLRRLEDARFKYGFFTSPDIYRANTDFSLDNIVFYEIETNEGLFTSNVDLRESGIGMHVLTLFDLTLQYLNPEENPEKVIEPKKKESKKLKVSNFNKVDLSKLNFNSNYYIIANIDNLDSIKEGIDINNNDCSIVGQEELFLYVFNTIDSPKFKTNNIIIIEIPKENSEELDPHTVLDILGPSKNIINNKNYKYIFNDITNDTELLLNLEGYKLVLLVKKENPNLNIKYNNFERAVKIKKNATISSIIDDFINNNDENILDLNIIPIINDNLLISYTSIRNYIDTILRDTFKDSLKEFDKLKNKFIIVGNDNNYIINKNGKVEVVKKEKEEKLEPKESKDIKTDPIKILQNSLNNCLQILTNNKLIVDEIREDEELFDVFKDLIKKLKQKINANYDSVENLHKAISGYDYSLLESDILSIIKLYLEDVYNQLFKDC